MSAHPRPLRRALLLLVAALLLTGGALAANQLTVRAGDALTVQGTAPDGAWVGVSLYPPRATSGVQQGKHMVRQVEGGSFVQYFSVPAEFRGGTYEVALWRTKVGLAQCKIAKCSWCARNGFHMEGMLGYRTGLLPKGR